jgi:hypothetical protein
VVASEDFACFDRADSLAVKAIPYRRLFAASWTSTVLTVSRGRSFRNTRRLDDISTIRSGMPGSEVLLIRDDAGHSSRECERIFRRHTPFGHLPAILSRNVHRMSLREITFYSRVNRRDEKRPPVITTAMSVAVRRLVSAGGGLVAAPLLFKALPVKGVMVVDQLQIDPFLLSAILGSSTVAHWLKLNTGTHVNPNFQSVAIGDLRRIPLPEVACKWSTSARASKAAKSEARQLCSRIVEAGKTVRRSSLAKSSRTSLFSELDRLVKRLYDLSG